MRISDLPEKEDPTGDELVIILDGAPDEGVAKTVSLGTLVAAALATLIAAATATLNGIVTAGSATLNGIVTAGTTAINGIVTAATTAIDASVAAAATSESNAAASATNAATSAAGVSIPLFAAAFKAALGPTANLRLLADFEGPRTAYSGSGTISQALASLDDTPLTLSVHTTISSVANPRPVYTPGRGFSFSSQAGFQNTTNQIITSTANSWALFGSWDLNVTMLSSTVALKTDLAGLGGVEGDMAKVIGDTRTNLSPDLLNVLDQDISDASLVNGWYKNINGSFAAGNAPGYLFEFRDATKAKYFRGSINRLGQLYIDIYQGSGTTVYRAFSKGAVVFGGKLNIAVYNDRGRTMTLFVNGVRMYGRDISALPDLTDLAELLLNGSDRTSNAVLPITGGFRHYFRGLAFAQSVPEANFMKAQEVFMQRHSSPVWVRPSRLVGVVNAGQSHAGGYFNITDTWTTATGYNGTVTVPSAFDIGLRSPTREAAPNVLGHNATQLNGGQTQYADIAAFGIRAANGTGISAGESHVPAPQGEAYLHGCFKQINAHPDGAAAEYIVHLFNYPGISLSQLTSEPNTYLPAEYKTANIGLFELVAGLKQQIILARDHGRAHGQKYTCDLLNMFHGHANSKITGFTDTPTYATDFITWYDSFNAWVKLVCDQTHDVTVILIPPDYSQTGVCNNTVAQCQRMIDIEAARGTRPIYMGPSESPFTSFIHNDPYGQRGMGEAIGLAARRAMFDGERYVSVVPFAYTYTVGGTTIDIDYHVRSGEYLRFRDSNGRNIRSRQTDSGIDTYGYGYFQKSLDVTITIANPGVITWAAHGLANGSLVRLNTLGALPTGLSPATDYYVVNATTNNFQLALTNGGAAIATSGTQSGVHTAYDVTVKIASVVLPSSTVTVAAGVVTWAAHGLANGVKVRLSTTGTLPTGYALNTDYFVVGATAGTFQLAATPGGSAIAASGGTGVHTVTSASRVRVTLAAPIVANSELQYAGFNCRYGNLASSLSPTAYYKDQDFTTLVSGSPVLAESASYNDLTLVAMSSRKVLP